MAPCVARTPRTTRGSLAGAARRAAQNVLRFLQGQRPQHLVDRSEYVEGG